MLSIKSNSHSLELFMSSIKDGLGHKRGQKSTT